MNFCPLCAALILISSSCFMILINDWVRYEYIRRSIYHYTYFFTSLELISSLTEFIKPLLDPLILLFVCYINFDSVSLSLYYTTKFIRIKSKQPISAFISYILALAMFARISLSAVPFILGFCSLSVFSGKKNLSFVHIKNT